MTTPFLQPGQPGGRDPIAGANAAQPGSKAPTDATSHANGAAFKALLERLQVQAAELQQTSKTLEDASELPNAVDAAKASLDDAVTLSDQLLEAFRQSQHQPDDDLRDSA